MDGRPRWSPAFRRNCPEIPPKGGTPAAVLRRSHPRPEEPNRADQRHKLVPAAAAAARVWPAAVPHPNQEWRLWRPKHDFDDIVNPLCQFHNAEGTNRRPWVHGARGRVGTPASRFSDGPDGPRFAVVSLSLLLLCPATLLGQHLALRQKAVGTPAKLTTQQQELLVVPGHFKKVDFAGSGTGG